MWFVVVSVLLGLVYSEVPVILTHPTNITVSPGASAEFYCKGEGSPTPTVMFTPEHYLSEVIDRPRAQRRGEGVVSTRKNFLAVSEADEGWYVCIAANSEGIATSRAYLRVKDLCKKMKCSKKETCVVNNELGTASCQCTACEDTKKKGRKSTVCSNMHLKSALLLLFGVMLAFLLISVPAENVDQDDVRNYLEEIADYEEEDNPEDDELAVRNDDDDNDQDNDNDEDELDDITVRSDNDDDDTTKVADPKALWFPRVRRVRLPRVRLPRVRLPRVRLPRVRLPRVRLPRFRVPRFRVPRLPSWGRRRRRRRRGWGKK